ncbi:peptidase G2 autoproteolytic cleavage domain-containing protein [Clostridium butyricum]|uniref:peptidase G2 autoproteolytic cleavage domain-containing protein n=1 Tax=Clostridium butyricum TaxID=1492 RepID=UPI00071B6D0B|nr:peptidase G2 autoproteolytic cleavage domain-containing protein [Clostridium butyricum]ALP91165.1 hypothetical protein ATN24_13795 [Clostridium butyricum]ANF14788.1 hypothetical protein AZ909_12250 [Clostridium butyricum]MDP0841078.1 peptidase G2 autoproteolytic cleavage domain-containing protein [Clostridium butyricum]NVO93010.1 hypothetical protein [Clostridium butyricum]RSC96968.1 hypothetical protein EI970_13900 [Clostridium butyricum]
MESYEVQLKDFKKAEQELTGKERVFISQDNNTRSTTIDEIRKPLAEQLNDNTQLLNDTFPLIENYLGICSSIIDEQKVSLMNECGYSYLRIDLSWDIIEHEKGIYDFSFPDKVINLLNKYNIKPFFIFCYNNDFYSGTPGNLHTGIYTEENRNAFCNYVSAIVERYKGNNYHYEIWNEPNGAYWGESSVNDYFLLVKKVYPIVKQIDGSAIIVTPTLGHNETSRIWFDNCCKLGLLNYTDKISLHHYTGGIPEDSMGLYNSYKAIIIKNSKPENKYIPIIASEFGYSTTPQNDYPNIYSCVCTEEERANWIPRNILLGLIYKIDKIFIHTFTTDKSTNHPEKWFGLYDGNLNPSLTALSVNNLINELKGYRFIRRINTVQKDYVLLFMNNDKFKIAYWTADVNQHLFTLEKYNLTLKNSVQYMEVELNNIKIFDDLMNNDYFYNYLKYCKPGLVTSLDTYEKSEIFNDINTNVANGKWSHAEGQDTQANGDWSHAEGQATQANGTYSHAEGLGCKAIGPCSSSHGQGTTANGAGSTSFGVGTTANSYASIAIGNFGRPTNGGGDFNIVHDAFNIGNGTSRDNLSNAFRITYGGGVYGLSAFNSSGADFAEFHEWEDGNTSDEDRIGYFVTNIGKNIKKAKETDFILGVISGNPCLVGNSDEDWINRYLKDEFGRFMYEDFEEEILQIDKETGEMTFIKTGNIIKNGRFKLNPNYDNSKEYIERKERKEWDYVCKRGMIAVRDDGTCEVGKWCKCNNDSIATISEARGFDTFMVLERIAENIVLIEFK